MNRQVVVAFRMQAVAALAAAFVLALPASLSAQEPPGTPAEETAGEESADNAAKTQGPAVGKVLKQCVQQLEQTHERLRQLLPQIEEERRQQQEAIKAWRRFATALIEKRLRQASYEPQSCEELAPPALEVRDVDGAPQVVLRLQGRVLDAAKVRRHFAKQLGRVAGLEIDDAGLEEIEGGICREELPGCAIAADAGDDVLKERTLRQLSKKEVQQLPEAQHCAELGAALQQRFPQKMQQLPYFWVRQENGRAALCRMVDNEWGVRRRMLRSFSAYALACL